LTLDDATGAPTDLTCVDIPVGRVRGRMVLDAYALARIVDEQLDPARYPTLDLAVLEQGGVRPQNGRVGASTFWLGLGVVRGILAAHFVPLEIVSPSGWKHAMRVTTDKDSSRLRASAIFPRWAGQWSRVKDHGRAEAALIALHGAARFPRGGRQFGVSNARLEGVGA
jgi:crossover junction endodeoxyribonuclease RuvC